MFLYSYHLTSRRPVGLQTIGQLLNRIYLMYYLVKMQKKIAPLIPDCGLLFFRVRQYLY